MKTLRARAAARLEDMKDTARIRFLTGLLTGFETAVITALISRALRSEKAKELLMQAAGTALEKL